MFGSDSKYFDKRCEFFAGFFAKASKYEDYVNSGSSSQRAKWEAFYEQSALEDKQLRILAEFRRKMNVLFMSGIWCGDCARQGPIFRRIQESASLIDCRFIDNQSHPELRDELRILGAERVPVVVFLSEDFFEIGRYGDRTLAAYVRKAENELGVACDAGLILPARDELHAEIDDWLREFERLQLMLRLAPALRARYKD